MADIKYKHPTPVPIGPVPPIPIPIDFVTQPFPDKQDYEYLKEKVIYDGVSGLPKINTETGQRYVEQ